jgi:hypothetical protein
MMHGILNIKKDKIQFRASAKVQDAISPSVTTEGVQDNINS